MSIRVHFIDAERKALYGAIFPDGVPVTSPVQSLCKLDGAGEQPCYILDFQAISMDQYNALVEAIALRFGAVRVAVASEIAQNGLPIRADQTTLVLDGPHLGLLMPDAVEDGLVSIRGRTIADELRPLEQIFGSAKDDFADFDDDDSAEYAPNLCPKCGQEMDGAGYCTDMLACGYSITRDDSANEIPF